MNGKKDYNRSPLSIFISYILGQKKLFLIDMGCATFVAVIDLIFPYISRECMYELLPGRLYKTFIIVMLLLVAGYLLKSLMYYIIAVLGHKMGNLVEAQMRRDIFTHIEELSFSFFDHNRTGALMSRITSDLFDLTELAHHGPEIMLTCTLTIIGSLAFMFSMEWRLTLALLLVVGLSTWFTLTQRIRMKKANIEVKRKNAIIYSAIESSISGVRTSKAFANEDKEAEKFDEANDLYIHARFEFNRSMGRFNAGMEFTTGIMPVMVIFIGGLLTMKERLNYVDLITFSLYVSTFVSPVRKLTQFTELWMQGTAGLSRFMEIMRTEPEITDSPDAEELCLTEGRVDFENVSFAYDNGIPVLSNINLSIMPGECCAVVGPSGGGKTTLCHLLPRFYDVTGGAVKVDGRDVRSVTQDSLRKNIGIIQQDVFMFAGTVKDNIRYGRPDATDEEVVEAAVRAEIHQDIMEMPDGYDSYIGERGVMLSGGQKQRISIARVFLKNPKILILDEATSALDTVTEQRIQASLEELSVGRTTLIIAHRLSTIKGADKIAVVEGERIVEEGSHEELMALNGEYAKLCRAQSMEGELETC